jgi:hypothetical protein
MRNILLYFSLCLIPPSVPLEATVAACPLHSEEIHKIRRTACDSLVEAHKLTGDVVGSIVVTTEDMAWNSVKQSSTYTDFSKTFQGGIDHCNKKGKFLASRHLYRGFDDVGNLFICLYDNCILNHHNYRSVFERGKIHYSKDGAHIVPTWPRK